MLIRCIFCLVTVGLLITSSLFGWGNPTHMMIGEEIRSMEPLPAACLTDRFVVSNSIPDMFAMFGPWFAHSDYRFAEILLEVAGDDLEKQAFAYGFFGHMAEDAIVHTEWIPFINAEHVIKELSVSALLYYDNPHLRESARKVDVGYYPQMIREASEIYMERYNQGRIITDEEMRTNARLLMFGIVGQQIVMRNILFQSWASWSVPRSDWTEFYERSIGSAYSTIMNAWNRMSHAGYHAHTHSHSDSRSLALLGEMVCEAMDAVPEERDIGDYVSISLTLPESADREHMVLTELLASGDLDESLQWLSGYIEEVYRAEFDSPASEISLFPSHPNPFNASTKVTLKSDIIVDRTDISVVNLAGQHVSRLFSGSFSVGVHTFDWDGTDDYGRQVASGVYFVTVRTDNITLIQKLMLVK